MATTAIRLAEHVYRIPTTPFDFVNTFAFVDDDGSVTLVDCGLKQAPARIVAGLLAIGKAPGDVQRIILTHAHSDHIGGAAAMSGRTGLGIDVHTADAGFARTGTEPPIDPSSRLGALISGRRKDGRPGFEPVEVATELHDGQILDVAGGLQVVHTPGHTPGHISLLHAPSGVLITGDAIFNVLRLRWPVRAFCSDVALTHRTAQRLADLDYTTAAFTHGPQISDRARERVRAFLAAAG
jgi:glyoxylase-like metal-dependent hydrolase (beta-lactamase superfamily II)